MMPRNISFAMTTPQFIDGSKDVTRRFAWWKLKPGDILMAVEKGMGLQKGEKIKRLGLIEIISVKKEPLNQMAIDREYGLEEMRREGYPFGMKDPAEFVRRMAPNGDTAAMVNRIEFRKISDDGSTPNMFENQ